MRARKGTGRAVAARTFSLVLRAPHERVEAAAARMDERDASFDGSRANGARSMSASADSAGDGSGDTFNADDFVPAKDRRRMDDFIIYGLSAAEQAIADSGWVPSSDEEWYSPEPLSANSG